MKVKDVNSGSQELTIFNVAGIVCGIDTSYVQEINKSVDLTIIFNAPSYVRGVSNLRGQIVTVIDLRKKFEMESVELNENMRIVIVKFGGENIGLLVDSIDDIVVADEKEIEPPPANIKDVTGRFFKGIFKVESALIAILNIEEILKYDSES